MPCGRLLALVAVLSVLGGCGSREEVVPSVAPEASEAREDPFTEVAWGIDFRHYAAVSPDRLLPETMGSGVAAFDYDGDGRVDLYFVNGASWDGAKKDDPPGRLYRNLGEGRFEEVTERAGLDAPFPGMGAVAGDLDGDGDEDLIVTGVGGARLHLNDGAGGFDDATAPWGLDARGFLTAAVLVDVDRDGWLDLYLGRYVEWSPQADLPCRPDGLHRVYCTPEVYEPVPGILYRNLEGRGFEDESARSGIGDYPGKALGAVALDVDRDGWPELAVANDTERNFLFVNRGDGTFVEEGVERGIAFGPSGAPRGGMGIDAGDLFADGTESLVVGNFSWEMPAVFRPGAEGTFRDVAAGSGAGLPGLSGLAFGTLLLDYDGDGWLDVLFAQGHIEPEIAGLQSTLSYAQPLLLLRNAGAGEAFEPVHSPTLEQPRVARGSAVADLDLDGSPDLVISQSSGPAVVLRNTLAARRIAVRPLVGAEGRSAFGAEVSFHAGGAGQRRRLVSGRSYLSSSEPVLFLGLGRRERVDLDVLWPSGVRQRLSGLRAGRRFTLVGSR